MEHQSKRSKRKGLRLQTRMSLSYLATSMCMLLLLELLLFATIGISQIQNGGIQKISGIFVGIFLLSCFGLVILVPAGALFGVIFTRGLVQRIRRLIAATAHFAAGDYQQRVVITKRDEIGQLEQQFNEMAEQLVESIKKQQELTERNVRIEERARVEQELQTARVIQHSLLPKTLPQMTGWQIATYYQPAREVGGDLYDFLPFADGKLGLVIGDVTDKGVAAAIVMASTRSMLQAAAQTSPSPGEVLMQVNNLLYADTPASMFVTCFYGILDPKNGTLRFANAGHDLPYQRLNGKAEELVATGMPLGLMPNMHYEEQEITIAHDESILFYSDGLVEAHSPTREIFGFPRLQSLLTGSATHPSLIDFLLDELKDFTGDEWEQEDDVTLVTLQRMPEEGLMTKEQPDRGDMLLNWSIASQPSNEQLAIERVTEVVSPLNLPAKQLANLNTAVAETVMNAMEHGNGYQADKMVELQVYASESIVTVRVHDQGTNNEPLPDPTTIATPDLTAKLAGLQTPRGWGLFLIKSLVDELHISKEEGHRVIELVMSRQSEPDNHEREHADRS